MVKHALCTHCGACKRNTESEDYRTFGRDISACPSGLITLCGTELRPEDVLSRVLPLKEMLALTEGGVTFSGGEPLSQPEFVKESFDLLREAGVHTAIETCGYADPSVFRSIVLERCDYVMMDLKIMDNEKHRRYTGVSNEVILENARALMESGIPFEFRTPLIPGITDTSENLTAIRDFVGTAVWEKLPYNELAGAKYPMLDRVYPYGVDGEVKKTESTV